MRVYQVIGIMKSEDGLAMAALLLLSKARILRKLYGILFRYDENAFYNSVIVVDEWLIVHN